MGLYLSGWSSIFASINFLVTIFGLCVYKGGLKFLDLFVWCMVVVSFLLLMSLPVLAGALRMIFFDRNYNMAFFRPVGGGRVLMYQHLF